MKRTDGRPLWSLAAGALLFCLASAWTIAQGDASVADTEMSAPMTEPQHKIGMRQTNVLHDLTKMVKKTDSQIEWVSLYHGDKYQDVPDYRAWLQLGEKIVQQLNMPPHAASISKQGDNYLYELTQRTSAGSLHLKWIGMSKYGDEAWTTYLIVRVKSEKPQADDLERLNLLSSELEDNLRALDIFPQFNTSVRGVYNGILNPNLQNKRISLILSNFNASIVEKMEDETVISISAYTTDINRSISTNGMSMNLQVATHVDTDHNQTYLTVGTPIIMDEY